MLRPQRKTEIRRMQSEEGMMREAGSDDAHVKRDEKRTNLVKGENLMKYQKLYTLLCEATYN
jgi:hypothetical protein